MFRRFGCGWAMVRMSWSVIARHPKLLMLPALSGATLAVLLALTLEPLLAAGGPSEPPYVSVPLHDPLLLVASFATVYLCAAVIVFFNAALVFCVLAAFNSEEPSLCDGIRAAFRRTPHILAWAAVSATIGILLKLLESMAKIPLGWFGSLLSGVMYAGRTATTYFALPVLVVEAAGPVTAIRRSAAVLHRCWGEATLGEGQPGLIAAVLFLPGLVLLGAAFKGTADAAGFIIGLTAAYGVLLVAVFTALTAILQTSAYVLSMTGRAPKGMDETVLRAAFRTK